MWKPCVPVPDHILKNAKSLGFTMNSPILILEHFNKTQESLSNEDGNGNKNVTQKVNSHCFKLHRSYSNSFNLSNVSDFSGAEF